uniref:Uncharacterized protein n=1 Tax=Anguilla anguilla TaxID=7936 RepID=A0A0E9TR73_ANGAN
MENKRKLCSTGFWGRTPAESKTDDRMGKNFGGTMSVP